MTTVKKTLTIILASCAGLLAILVILPHVDDIIRHCRYERAFRKSQKAIAENIRSMSQSVLKGGEGSCYNLIILDESGSMTGLEEATIAGANETISAIRAAADSLPELKQYLTMVTFSTRSRGDTLHVLNDATPIAEVKTLSPEDYRPEAMTPLYDAVGDILVRMNSIVPEESAVLVTIITDGLENASCRYTSDNLAQMIGMLEERGWTFTYLGANQNAILEARKIGVSNAMNYDADVDGVKKMYGREKGSRIKYYDRLSTTKSRMDRMNAGKDYFEDNQ